MKLIHLSSFLFIVSLTKANAQILYEYNGSNVPVTMNSQLKKTPWAGGVETPMLTMGDINNDGKADMVVFERSPRQIKTFINTGTVGSPNYTFEPRYILNFPAGVSEYLTLADYNGDNIPDLFTNLITDGCSVFKGYYNNNNELCFNFYKSVQYWNDQVTVPPVNVYLKSGDVPCIIDIDGDSDLDFLAYNLDGERINYLQNMQVEAGLPADSIRMELRDRCWGKVVQNVTRTHLLDNSCDNSDLQYNVGQRSTESQSSLNNGLCVFRGDDDSDFDLLDGSSGYSDIQFLKNGKAENSWGVDTMISQDTTWMNAFLQQYPTAFYLDGDQDGNMDILLTPHLEGSSNNYKNIQFFRNQGTTNNPIYVYQNDSFLVSEMIDMGSNSSPMLYDYDRDGKLDLIVGSGGYFQTGIFRSKLAYYRNTSTGPGNASFSFESYNLLQLDTMTVPSLIEGAAPTAGDVNSDGKDDLILGESDGTLTYFENIATSNSIQPIWSNPVRRLRDENNVVIDIGTDAMPFIYDMDQDGKKDLVIGTAQGYFVYYQNVGSLTGDIKFRKVNDQLGNVKADPQTSSIGHSSPFIGKVDDTNIDYLVSGSNSGAIYRFDGFQTGDTTVSYTTINDLNLDFASLGVRTTPTFGDIDGDGKKDLVLGTKQGGLLVYRQNNFATIPRPIAEVVNEISIYPNPAKNELYVRWENGFTKSGIVTISIVNSLGQKLLDRSIDARSNSTLLDISEFPSGIYFFLVVSDVKQQAIVLSVVK